MLKDKKISIIHHEEREGEFGETTHVDVPLPGGGNVWAYYRHVTGKEYYNSLMVKAKEEALFIINWRDDIDTAMKIKFRDKLYNITRIDDFEGYKKDLKIYAYKID